MLIGLLFSLFYDTSVEAKTCKLDAANPQPTISNGSWVDQAQYSFYLGQSFNNRMVMQSRFNSFNKFQQLKLEAGKWPNKLREGQRLSAQIMAMRNDVQTLLSICKRLDESDLDGVPFNFAKAERELRSIRDRIIPIMLPLTNYQSYHKTYSSLVSAASQYYAERNFPTNPDLVIDPNPITVASQLVNMQALWRAILEDFEQIYTGVTISVNPNNETDIINMSVQAKTLNRLIEQTRALGINNLSLTEFLKFTSGDFLYENCPIQEGKWYEIHNSYRKNHKLVDMDSNVRIVDTTSIQWLETPPVFKRGLRWKFTKDSPGFWKIQSQLAAEKNKALYTGGDKEVKTIQWKRYSGQFWRCYKTRWPNRYRFSSSFASEEKSLDTYRVAQGDKTRMEPTSGAGGQLWILVPQ
jgi:hypothetical protein